MVTHPFVIRQDCIKQFIKNWKLIPCQNVVWHVLEEGSTMSELYVFGQELHAVSLFNSHTLCVAYIQTFTHTLFIDHGKEGF